MTEKKPVKIFDFLVFFFAVFAVAYCVLRAYCLGLTHDEAVSYLLQKIFMKSYLEIMFYTHSSANSHLLNTVLMRFFSGLFGDSEIVLRFSALLAYLIYLPGLYMTLKLFLRGAAFFLGFVFCSFHPFLIDYFSCARGYGLGVGFMTWGLYFLMRKIERDDSGVYGGRFFVLLSCLAFSLSALGNFVFLQAYVVAASLFLALFLIRIVRGAIMGIKPRLISAFLKEVLLPIFPSILVISLFCSIPLMKLLRANEFYYGGTTGFWTDTVGSLIYVTIYVGNQNLSQFVPVIMMVSSGLIVVALLAASWVLLRDFLKRCWGVQDAYLFGVMMFLVGSAAVIILQHDLLNSKYVMDRTAIYFIPAFSIFVLLLWARVFKIPGGWGKAFLNVFFMLFLSGMSGHYFSRINLSYYCMSLPDADIKKMMLDLISLNRYKLDTLQPRSIGLGINWLSEPVVNYYIFHYNLWWLRPAHRGGPLVGHYDYYYLFNNPDFDNRDLLMRLNLRVIRTYSTYDTFLAASQVEKSASQ